MNARQVFAVVFRVFCQRPMPTNDGTVSGTATAKVNKRRLRQRQRQRQRGGGVGVEGGRGRAWPAAAFPAFDLIERRLFGFKNVNQIHLIPPHFLASTAAFIFYIVL